jgi:arsenate reductase (thioredoxin)
MSAYYHSRRTAGRLSHATFRMQDWTGGLYFYSPIANGVRMPIGRRLALSLGLCAWVLAGCGSPGERKADTKAAQVVFVCEHGSVKSLMAASYFNQLARERGLAMHAVARGMTPDESVPEKIAQALSEDGFEVRAFIPVQISNTDVEGSTRVVAIGVALDGVQEAEKSKVERWDDVPAASVDYPAARQALKTRVARLLDRMQASPSTDSSQAVKCDTWEDVLVKDDRKRTVYMVREGCSGLSNGLDVAIDLELADGKRTTVFAFADGSWDARYTDRATPTVAWIDSSNLLISVGAVGSIHKKLEKVGETRITYRIDHVLSEEPPTPVKP